MTELMKIFPGISCAYIDKNGSVEYECYGVADKGSNIKTDVNTIFPACSISKWITAICVMRLNEQDILDIDKPVQPYLSPWKIRDVNGKECDVTLRHLLSHTSGIHDGENGFYGHRRTDKDISIPDILNGVTGYNNKAARVEQTPGSSFEYSDAGFCVIQLILENVTGKSFEELARELIFDKLGLSDIFFGTRSNLDAFEKKGQLATGYAGDGSVIDGNYPVCPDLAASGLWSSPNELLKIASDFAASMDGCGKILSKDSVTEMIKPAFNMPWVGLGLFRYGDDVIISKGWGENGQCMLKIDCRNHSVGVVMTNKDPEIPQEESGVEKLVFRM